MPQILKNFTVLVVIWYMSSIITGPVAANSSILVANSPESSNQLSGQASSARSHITSSTNGNSPAVIVNLQASSEGRAASTGSQKVVDPSFDKERTKDRESDTNQTLSSKTKTQLIHISA